MACDLPLRNNWSVFGQLTGSHSSYIDSLKLLGDFATAKGFWKLWLKISGHMLDANSCYGAIAVFKDDVLPM
ncbi:unnamed protein product [Vitrella brassicaformis CCMP3155]|uniref:Uncharacterized protein n=1 Tax=Vitrella brassicaformis (strain CCMP3155) TaxID=1169540 RepID=A0A0G4EV05_VITBC|nr:unnamed protein product [Vitrella brassicaformis CCMP3155]|eukprot:CEM01872.1 unnamed protein product [Vitrella brassicaformis CCMP3155]